MNIQTVKAIAAVKNMNQSDLARAAGVSRQSVSQWFQEKSSGFINIQTKHLLAIADALEVSADDLLRPLPLIANKSISEIETTKLLWDKLYPDIVTLIIAALDDRHDAVARIVQAYGLYAAAKMLGTRVWQEFPRYKRYLKPARQVELERVWTLRQNRTKR